MSTKDPIELDPASIEVRDRLRALDEERVLDLVDAITLSEWVSPGIVRRHFNDEGDEVLTLIAGAHRLAACKRLGRQFPATLMDEVDCSSDRAQLLEIAENLVRAELTAAERILHQQALHKVLREELGPWVTKTTLSKHTSRLTKRSLYSTQSDVRLAENVTPEALGMVVGTHLDRRTALEKVQRAGPTPEEQKAYVKTTLSNMSKSSLDRTEGRGHAAAEAAGILTSGLAPAAMGALVGLLRTTTMPRLLAALKATNI